MNRQEDPLTSSSSQQKRFSTISSLFSITLFLIVLLSLSSYVSASAGIRFPSIEERTFTFEPGKVVDIEFSVYGAPHLTTYLIGSDHKPVPYAEVIDENQGSGSRSVRVRITMPPEMAPGKNLLYFGVVEGSPDTGATMGGRAAAQSTIYIINLYDEPKAEAKLSVKDTGEGKNTKGELRITSLSKVPVYVNNAKIVVKKVSSKSGESKKGLNDSSGAEDGSGLTLDLGSFVLDTPLQSVSKSFILPTARLDKGVYRAELVVSYSGGPDGDRDTLSETRASTIFRIGSKDVKLVDYTSQLKAGTINRVEFKVLSLWNNPLEVYGRLFIDGKEVGVAPAITLSSFGEGSFPIYVDTEAYPEGLLKADLEIKLIEKDLDGGLSGAVARDSDADPVVKHFDPFFNISSEAPLPPEPEVTESPSFDWSDPSVKVKLLVGMNIFVFLLVLLNLFVILKKNDDKKE